MNLPWVPPDKLARLQQRMHGLKITESEMDEHFVRSGGPGGQHVNKTATCVILIHRPTGLMVKCQSTRQQGLNRVLARQILLDKIESWHRDRQALQRAHTEKIRRQKRRRSPQAKERMLADKAHRADKKASRRQVPLDH